MKQITIIALLLGFTFAHAQNQLKGYCLNEKGQPLEGIMIMCPQLHTAPIITNARGGFELATPATDQLKIYDEMELTFHSDLYRVAEVENAVDYIAIPQENKISVTLAGRKKGNITIRMNGKNQIIPLATARLTPEPVSIVAVQIASMAQDKPETKAYYEAQLKMSIHKHYKGERVIYAVHTPSVELAETMQKAINARKIKGIDRAFIVAIEDLRSPIVYRVQIAATPQPLSEKEKTGFSDKLAKVHRTFIEDITQDSVYKFKYYTNDFFGDEGKAKDFAKKLQKLGIKGYVISFKEENNRL